MGQFNFTSVIAGAINLALHGFRHENEGSDEISIDGLDGISTELASHAADVDAHGEVVVTAEDAGTATSDDLALTITGGEGIDTTATGTTVTIAGEDASDTNKGVAKFDADSFSVSSGDVDLTLDDVPVDGEVKQPITSNWAYDLTKVTREPTGFPNTTDTSAPTFSSPTVTLAKTNGSFDFYIKGVKFTKSANQTVALPNGDATDIGTWYIAFNSSGVLTATKTTSWDLAAADTCPVAVLYFNGTAGKIADERHGTVMDAATHDLLHYTVGCRFESGLIGTFTDPTAIDIASGKIHDEDLEYSIGAQTQCIPFYHSSGVYTFAAAQNSYVVQVSDILQYDNLTNLVDVSNNSYVAYWIFATFDTTMPIWIMPGQREDGLLKNARNNNKYESLSLGTLPFPEMKLLYRVILRRSGTSETYVETQDLRTVSNLPSGTYVATDHAALTGLLDDDHTQYILHSLADAANDFLVASGNDAFAKQTAAQVLATLSGDAGAAFDWNSQELTGIDRHNYNETNLLENGSFEVGDPPDDWTLVGGLATVSRSSTQAKIGTYSALLTRNGTNCHIYQAYSGYATYAGKTVTLGCWAYATEASRVGIGLGDGSSSSADTHTGVAGWEWLTSSLTVDASPTYLRSYLEVFDGDTSAYFDGAILVEGDSCPAFSPKPIGTYDAITLRQKLTAGAVEIEGSAFDINGGTIDGVTITAPTINGTIATTGLTMPAFTLGGTVTENGQYHDAGAGNMEVRTTGALTGMKVVGSAASHGPGITLYHEHSTPADETYAFEIAGIGYDGAGAADFNWGVLYLQYKDIGNGTEAAAFKMFLASGGALTERFRFNHGGDIWCAAGGRFGGNIVMTTHKITGLAAGTVNGDSVRYEQLTTHANLTAAHGAVSAATASKMVVRDASARAKFAAPGAAGDPLIKGTRVTTAELPTLTENKIWAGNGSNEPVEADPIPAASDWKGSFNWDTSANTTNEVAISTLFSTNLDIATRRRYTIRLYLAEVEADGSFDELYLAVKEEVKADTPGAEDRKTVTKANLAATAEPVIIIDVPTTADPVFITMQMKTALAGDATIYYAVVKEHLE